MLESKSIHDLRQIAQSFGIAPDKLFQMDAVQLRQAIELRQEKMQPVPEIVIPKPEYDARLMTKPPSKSSTQDQIVELLKPFTSIGMHLDFPEAETWRMRHGKKEDTGTIRQPLRIIRQCAEKIMK